MRRIKWLDIIDGGGYINYSITGFGKLPVNVNLQVWHWYSVRKVYKF